MLVLAARDLQTEKSLEPDLFQLKGRKPPGLFHPGWEKEYVTLRLDSWGTGAHELVYLEYTHSIMQMNTRWLPAWLNEGVAEFYAYTRFQQNEVYVGALTKEPPGSGFQTFIPD